MTPNLSVVHSLPVNIEADGVSLVLPSEFVEAGELNLDAATVHTAHLRGRKLYGKTFEIPIEAEFLVVQNEDSHDADNVSGILRPVAGPVEKLVIWNTDAPNDIAEKIRSALLWSKLNAALSK